MENNTENLIKDKKHEIPGSGKQGEKITPEIIVHSMPKRYLASGAAQNHKYIGLFILLGGFVFMLVLLAGGYYFFYKSSRTEVRESQEQGDAVENESVDQTTEEAGKNIENTEDSEGLLDESGEENQTNEEFSEEYFEEEFSDSGEIEESSSQGYSLSSDADADGLSDSEEALFGIDLNKADSDQDGYNDLTEILNLYDPAGAGKLADNESIKKYINGKYGYSIYYPGALAVSEVDEGNSIIFRFEKNQFVQIIAQPNENKGSIEDWYKNQFEAMEINGDMMMDKKGWSGIKSQDDLAVYLMDPKNENIFIVTYSLGLDNTLYYKNIFDMMVDSLEISR